MDILRWFRSRLRSLRQRRTVKQEIDEELRFHVEQRTADNLAAGMSPKDAAREARKRFGNWQTVREDCRDARGASFGEGFLRDLALGWRVLAKSPGFAFVAVLMLAVGSGSVTAMYSVMRVCILEPIASPNADRLVMVWSGEGQTVSTLDYLDLRDQASSFAELSAYTLTRASLGGDHPLSVRSVGCTSGLLRAFGVPPALGRWLEPADEVKGAAPVVVISHHLWQRAFAGDPALVGKSIRLDGGGVTVVGVMPPTFDFCSPWAGADNFELWRPLPLPREALPRGTGWWLVLGCVKPGVTLAAAGAEVGTIGQRLMAAYPQTNARKPFLVRSLREEMTRFGRGSAWMLFAAAALMLLVACANVASMLLTRGTRRQAEYGVRLALGASRGQVLRLALAESLLLALAGTLAGVLLAGGGLRFLRFLAEVSDARRAAMTVDAPVLAFAACLGLLTALIAGVPSALAALRVPVAEVLRSDGRGATGNRAQQRLLRSLVVGQLAAAFLLANLAVLFAVSYAHLLAAQQALATDHVLSAELNLSASPYAENEALARFCARLAERTAAIPGVVTAAVTSQLPLQGGAGRDILVNDEAFDPTVSRLLAECSEATPGYFAAVGVPLLRGRTLRPDSAGDYDEVVVNRTLAERCWPGQDPLGKIIRPNAPNAWFRLHVVGVVENLKRAAAEAEPPPQMYWSPDRAWGKTFYLVVRSSRPGSSLAPELSRAVAELDSEVPVSRLRTLKTIVREVTRDARVMAGLTEYCMLAAIGLAAVGLYGTLSYHVLQRTRELGVRMALGAGRHEIVRLVFRQGFGWVLAGLVLGVGGALAVATTLRALVYDVNPLNPFTLLASAATVALAASLACWWPARRAARMDPMHALRCE